MEDERSDEILIKGLRTSDSCYVTKHNKHELDAYVMFQKDEINIGHQRISHINSRDLPRINRKGIVNDFPRLTRNDW